MLVDELVKISKQLSRLASELVEHNKVVIASYVVHAKVMLDLAVLHSKVE